MTVQTALEILINRGDEAKSADELDSWCDRALGAIDYAYLRDDITYDVVCEYQVVVVGAYLLKKGVI